MTKNNLLSVRSILLLCSVLVLFVVFPFWNGMFFNVPVVYSSIYVSLLVLIAVGFAIFKKTEVKGFAWIDLIVGVYTFVVLLSVFSHSNLEYTLVGIAKQFAFLFIYVLVRMRLSSTNAVKIFFYVIAATGAMFSIYGLMAAVNVIHDGSAIFGGTGEKRLASVFQYPNTYASYLAIALLFGLNVLTEQKRWYSKAIWLFVNVMTFAGLVFTYSRGGWVIFAVALIVLLILAPKTKRWSLVLGTIATLLAMGASMSILHNAVIVVSAKKVFWGIAIGLVVSIVLAFLLEFAIRKVETLQVKKAILLPVAIVIVLVCGVGVWKLGLLPQDVLHRFTTINLQQFSAQQRLVFYKDGLSAIKDHPLFGAGDKTWEATFFKYQSYPYYTTSPHSEIINLLMDTGIIGTLLWLAIFVLSLRGFWRLRRSEDAIISLVNGTLLVAMLELVFHGAMDVDFDYGVINYLFFIFAAWSAQWKPLAIESETDLNSHNWQPKNRWFWWASVPVSLAVCLYGLSYVYANHQLDAAKMHLGEPAVALSYLDSANAYAPYITDVGNITADMEYRYYQRNTDPVILQNMQNTLTKIPLDAPNSAIVLAQTGEKMFQAQKPLDGYALFKSAWNNAPYRTDIAGQTIAYAEEIGEAYIQIRNQTAANSYFHDALNTYQEAKSHMNSLKQLPPSLKPEYSVGITGQMSTYAGLSAYHLGQYPQAEQMAIQGLQDPKADPTQLMALQVAAEQQQKKPVNAQLMASIMAISKAKQYYMALMQNH